MNSPFNPPDPAAKSHASDSQQSGPIDPQQPSQEILVPEGALPPREEFPPESFEARYAEPPENRPAADVPLDLRVPWGWGDVFLFAIFYFGSAILAGVLLVIAAAPIMHRGIQEIAQDKTLEAYFGIVAQAISSVLSLIYLAILVRVRRAGSFWPAIGWRPLPRAEGGRSNPILLVFAGMALAAIGGLADQFFPPSKPVPMEDMFQTRLAILMLSIFGILVAPLIEETIFRGLVYPVIGRSFGVPSAIIITGILFGAMHSIQLWGAWMQIGVIMCVGIVLTWVRATRKSVLASFIVHISYNSTIFLALFISTSGLRHMPTR